MNSLEHLLAAMLLPAAEGPTIYFVRSPDPLTYVLAAAITAGCALLANGAALAELIGHRISDHQEESAA